MAKAKVVYVCRECGAESPKWIGRCPSCNQWNTYTEEIATKNSKSPALIQSYSTGQKPVPIFSIQNQELIRIETKNNEFDRVLGGGLVPGSVVLLGGEPGIGKSTLLLQVALNIEKKVLYVSGEESGEQIKMRASRIGGQNNEAYFMSEVLVENIITQASSLIPDIIIIDSIQTLRTDTVESSPGTVSQIRECATALLRYAKENSVPVILVGHITKDGSLAGPKVLEHIVDTVLQFEGDTNFNYRIVRASKNRFGPTSEIGIFEMLNFGLREVSNPSELLLSFHKGIYSGIAIGATVEGIRPMLIEVQALVSSAVYGTPQRSATGFEIRRLNMLLAVLEKRVGFRLSQKDVFLNITGGIKIADPAIDLSVICAILSSDVDRAIPPGVCFAGEVGLSGEIRPTSRIENRIAEAEKLGYNTIFVPCLTQKLQKKYNIQILETEKIEQVFSKLFSQKQKTTS